MFADYVVLLVCYVMFVDYSGVLLQVCIVPLSRCFAFLLAYFGDCLIAA